MSENWISSRRMQAKSVGTVTRRRRRHAVMAMRGSLGAGLGLLNRLFTTGNQAQAAQGGFIGETAAAIPQKLSASMTGFPGIKGRNPFQTDLQILSYVVLEDVV